MVLETLQDGKPALLQHLFNTSCSSMTADTVAAPVSTCGDWTPAQYTTQPHIDLRASAIGPKGHKVKGKRKLEELSLLGNGDLPDPDAQQAEAMDEDDQPGTSERSSKRQKSGEMTYMPIGGRVPWKLQAQRSGTVMKGTVSTTWEKKMKDKAARKQFTELKRASVEAQKAKRKMAAAQKKASIERKKANQNKSQIVQKITSSATVKKMMKSKKQRKLLKTADTN